MLQAFLESGSGLPGDIAKLKLSPEALAALREALVARLREAAARAAQAGRAEIRAEDVEPLPAR